MKKAITTASIVATVLTAGITMAAVTAEQKCEGGKNDASGKYAACMARAERTLVLTGNLSSYDSVQLKCANQYAGIWSKLEGAGECPTTGDGSAVQGFVDACVQSVAEALGGGTLPPDVVTCNADLTACDGELTSCDADYATCTGDLGTCEDDLGACEAMPVCGDGLIGAGEECDVGNLGGATCATQSFAGGTLKCATGCVFETSGCWPSRYVDNGDGTVTDNQTKLMWEKKSATGDDRHGVGYTFQWSDGTGSLETPDGDAFTSFLGGYQGLNYNIVAPDGVTVSTSCFLDHCDWRIPTVAELRTLLLEPYPCSTDPCIDPIFGPTSSGAYWTSTATLAYTRAFIVWFGSGAQGLVSGDWTDNPHPVRAVRTAY